MPRFLSNLLITVWIAFLTAAAVESHRPAALGGVQGLEAPGKQPAPELLDRIEQAVWRRNAPLEISEADVNRYLAAAVTGRQVGASGMLATFERVALSFHGADSGRPAFCRAWLVWNAGGRRSNAAIDFTINREPQQFIVEPRGGSLGRLPVFRGALAALLPGLRSLCVALDEEIEVVFQMNQIRFERHKVILDPRFETGP